jgi:hypothetical protein
VVVMIRELAESRWSERQSELSDWTTGILGVSVSMEIVDGADSLSGTPDAVLPELDRRTVQSVKIAAEFLTTTSGGALTPDEDEILNVRFSRDDGVTLLVESRNPGWAKQCLAQLSDEIDKSVPKWSFFLSKFGRFCSVVFVLLAVLVVAGAIEARHIHHDASGDIQLTAFILIILTALLSQQSISPARIWHWIFPSFEVYGEGGSSSGGRRLAAIILFALTIIGGVIVNLIT